MKKLTAKIRYTVDGHVAALYAKPNSAHPLYSKRAGWVAFGTCHTATIQAMKEDGVKPHLTLVRFNANAIAPNSHSDAPTAPDTLPEPDRGSTGQIEGKAGQNLG